MSVWTAPRNVGSRPTQQTALNNVAAMEALGVYEDEEEQDAKKKKRLNHPAFAFEFWHEASSFLKSVHHASGSENRNKGQES